jgi:hypothetical protein
MKKTDHCGIRQFDFTKLNKLLHEEINKSKVSDGGGEYPRFDGGGATYGHVFQLTTTDTLLDEAINKFNQTKGGAGNMAQAVIIEGKKISFLEYVTMKYEKLQHSFAIELAQTESSHCGERTVLLRELGVVMHDEMKLINEILCSQVKSCRHPIADELFLVDTDDKVVKVL